ncbi:MAG: periplasmic heavy metal sensor [Stellaceae bacterium]
MTVITATTRRPARQPLLRVALALSLVLNLFFIVGAAWTRMHAPHHPGIAKRFHQIESQLALDPTQRQAFDRYAAIIESRARAMHQRIRPLIGEAWSEMAKPQAQATDVMRIFDQTRAERRSFEQDLTSHTLALLARLSPAQRQKFVALVHPHRRPPRPPAR